MGQRIKVSNGNVTGGIYTAYMQVVQNEDGDPRLVTLSDPNNILEGMTSSIQQDVEEWTFIWESGSFVREAVENTRNLWNDQLGILYNSDPPPSYLPEQSLNMLSVEYICNSAEDYSVVSQCYVDDSGYPELVLYGRKSNDFETFYASKGKDWVKFTFLMPNNLSPVVD